MSRDGAGVGAVRRLALRTERLAELTCDEMRAVNGGAQTLLDCLVIHHPSDRFESVCGCLTRGCT